MLQRTFAKLLPLLMLAPPGIPTLMGAGVVVQFDPSAPDVGPFPTDYLTVPDSAQKTGLRVNMPLPDCSTHVTECTNLKLLNRFDGFNLNPEFRVRFSAPVDVDTIRSGIFFVALENLTNEEIGINRQGQVIATNRLFYDPLTNTIYGKPDDFMDQHRRYALLVTDAIRDPAGNPVESDPAFRACLDGRATDYCSRLSQVVSSLASSLAPARIVAASFFTTVSATAWFEKVRVALRGFTPEVERVGPKVFNFRDVASVKFRAQTQANPVGYTDTDLPLADVYAVGRIAFGSYTSPDFRDENRFIADPPTLAPVALPAKTNRVYFNLFLPMWPQPSGGYPVVIICTGFGDTRFGVPSAMAPQFNALGFAVLAINAVGYGYGPESRVVITEKDGTVSEFLAGGRGEYSGSNGTITSYDGCPVRGALRTRDCIRQSAVDILELVAAIRNGIDLDRDGRPELDASRISIAGHSAGAVNAVLAFAVEPSIVAAAFEEGFATVYDAIRSSQTLRPLLSTVILADHIPSLFNNGPDDFNDNFVLRDLPVRVNDVPGAVELHNFFELAEWLVVLADPSAWAPHHHASPLPGMPPRQALFLQAWGDRTIPNPSGTALVRAARSPDTVRYYRHDIASSIFPFLQEDPVFFQAYLSTDPEVAVALSAINLMGAFFASGGTAVPDVNDLMQVVFGTNIWVKPATLTETFNF